MADRKITELTALAAGGQATGDLLTIVDISETAALDKNKKVTVENLFKGIPGNVGIGTTAPGAKLDVNGEVLFSPNTAGKNTHTFTTNASNNGRYLIQADTTTKVDIQANGASFFNGGNVGIGTSSPSTKFVVSNGGAEGVEFSHSSGTNEINSYNRSTSARAPVDIIGQTFKVLTGNPSLSTGLFQDSSGNVGIGRTPFASPAGYPLQLRGSSTQTFLHLSTATHGDTNDDGMVIGADNSNAYIVQRENSPLIFYTNNTEAMRIDSSGNVGIGTTSPGLPLDVVSNTSSETVRFRGASGGVGTLRFTSNDGATNYSFIQSRSTFFELGTDASIPLKFATAGSERARIDSSGDVLIGTTSNGGGNRLYVVDNLTDSFVNPSDAVLRVENANTSGTSTQVSIAFTSKTSSSNADSAIVSQAEDGSGNASLQFWTDVNNGMSEKMRITSGGAIQTRNGAHFNGTNNGDNPYSNAPIVLQNTSNNTNATMIQFKGYNNSLTGSISTRVNVTTYSTSSDYRLKENVVAIADGITRVKQLAPKRFNFIGYDDTTCDGFLAHEAQDVVPEAVVGTHNEVDGDGNAVMQGIDQSKLVPLLTAALKEAIAKIETLETKVAALEAQ